MDPQLWEIATDFPVYKIYTDKPGNNAFGMLAYTSTDNPPIHTGFLSTDDSQATIRYQLQIALNNWPASLSTGTPDEAVLGVQFSTGDAGVVAVEDVAFGVTIPVIPNSPGAFQHLYTRAELPSPIPSTLNFVYDLTFVPDVGGFQGIGYVFPLVSAPPWPAATDMPAHVNNTFAGTPGTFTPYRAKTTPPVVVPTNKSSIRIGSGSRSGHYE